MVGSAYHGQKSMASKNYRMKKNFGLQQAIEAVGGLRALARMLNISHQAILQWDRIPDDRILEIEKKTGVAREQLRPDLYRTTGVKVD
jgi:DNA-binding transcriptional regulator YdaS (Cro superfamily)